MVSGTFKFDNFYLPENFFMSVLDDLDVQFISEKVKDEKYKQREEELKEFFKHLAQATKSVLGEISLKRLRNMLESHIGTTASHP